MATQRLPRFGQRLERDGIRRQNTIPRVPARIINPTVDGSVLFMVENLLRGARRSYPAAGPVLSLSAKEGLNR